ncbi:unnamed protein product [Cylicocyclus nassatus]|uniref:Uncharacterized protein n=1 Tax=Cylicocyclus nassatus TaxID=53992 RepID=A0AA36MED3_CYLNA|nr:unnamed protein product [Cylicocyclus nassatus]
MPQRITYWYSLYEKLDRKFTTFSLNIAAFIEVRSLLNVPEKQWRVFSVLAYIHVLLSVCLCVLGISCFCIGMVNSILYDRVSCSNGVNLFVPFINVVSSFAGLVAVRALHMNWPPFVHVVTLVTAMFSLCVVFSVSCLEAEDWYRHAVSTPEPIPDGVKYKNWAKVFADIDVAVVFIAIANFSVAFCELAIYAMYWFPRPGRS